MALAIDTMADKKDAGTSLGVEEKIENFEKKRLKINGIYPKFKCFTSKFKFVFVDQNIDFVLIRFGPLRISLAPV